MIPRRSPPAARARQQLHTMRGGLHRRPPLNVSPPRDNSPNIPAPELRRPREISAERPKSRRYLGVRTPVHSSQQATQRACDAIGCPSSTAENSPDIGDKFPGHTSPLWWLNSHHGLHTTTSGSAQVADMLPELCSFPHVSARGSPAQALNVVATARSGAQQSLCRAPHSARCCVSAPLCRAPTAGLRSDAESADRPPTR